MTTDAVRVDEIAPDVFRLSTLVPGIAPPHGFTFNQFLVRDDRSFLYHTGMRDLFPSVIEGVKRLIRLEDLRWISFAHVESDECGAMNDFLSGCPNSELVHGGLGCTIVKEFASRPPRKVTPGEVLDLGQRRMRFEPTPHVPHNWESGMWFEETTRTLFVGDLFAALGDGDAAVTDDLVVPAAVGEDTFHSTSMGPDLVPTLRRLAGFEPSILATMHGSSFRGDGAAQLHSLADHYVVRIAEAG